jgi:hypothetical protein
MLDERKAYFIVLGKHMGSRLLGQLRGIWKRFQMMPRADAARLNGAPPPLGPLDQTLDAHLSSRAPGLNTG